ncbi:fumarylacetoacetate hydrolase-like protein [Boeremia exigua]|uniref:fumarylacetoacetate hydrolase-like protein n=1 Tax=Boeremia exigua TaxID=749465 RepID=UPI001E8E713F|nr:fumarylacetoacetate hydrolase-like protein [Boeremia exigua]KAH6621922.1 fumarylacetoacetate hydrolase-like protein [Boeremia exigua]
MSSNSAHDAQRPLTNYVAYHDLRSQRDRIGNYDLTSKTIEPLSFKSGTPLTNIYQVIEAGQSNIISAGAPIDSNHFRILPPLADRDVLCVGKNYFDHAKEFNSSGFDSSDKVDVPSDPVIFTKRYTSIIADRDEIYPHPDFTSTADYEGEVGVIIGKAGFRIKEEDAMSHVWGFTIVNDMTARERQRDHKQFYIGKSPDTFCPMGPIAVPASQLPEVLRVQTYVNGELRQDATTNDLIFSVPYLIKTMSEGQTLQPGDVLATGTPAGVGLGLKPPVYLKPGDTIAISVTGLGTLTNRIASNSLPSPLATRIPPSRLSYSKSGLPLSQLSHINSKPLYYTRSGPSSGSPIVFIHGLGGTHTSFTPLIHTLGLTYTHSIHLFDLEGHGASPTHPLSVLSVSSFSEDVAGVFAHAGIAQGDNATIVAHSMGCLIALDFAIKHPKQVGQLILLNPPSLPFPDEGIEALKQRAQLVRQEGMLNIADKIAMSATSARSQARNPMAVNAVRLSLQGQDAEGYAKACSALANAAVVAWERVSAKVTIVTGSEDGVAPVGACEEALSILSKKTELEVVDGVGHWSVFEEVEGTAKVVENVLGRVSVASRE